MLRTFRRRKGIFSTKFDTRNDKIFQKLGKIVFGKISHFYRKCSTGNFSSNPYLEVGLHDGGLMIWRDAGPATALLLLGELQGGLHGGLEILELVPDGVKAGGHHGGVAEFAATAAALRRRHRLQLGAEHLHLGGGERGRGGGGVARCRLNTWVSSI
jgi:hypothetical protein